MEWLDIIQGLIDDLRSTSPGQNVKNFFLRITPFKIVAESRDEN